MSGNQQDQNKQLSRRWFEEVATGITIIRWKDGQIAEGWNQFDALGLMHQAGAIEFKTGG